LSNKLLLTYLIVLTAVQCVIAPLSLVASAMASQLFVHATVANRYLIWLVFLCIATYGPVSFFSLLMAWWAYRKQMTAYRVISYSIAPFLNLVVLVTAACQLHY